MKIKSISEWSSGGMAGWEIVLSGESFRKEKDGSVVFAFDSSPSCCEKFGWTACEDDLDRFVGSELMGFSLVAGPEAGWVSSQYAVAVAAEAGEEEGNFEWLDNGEVAFATITTSLGSFQFAFYNAHNGYYGHTVEVRVNGVVVLEEVL